jgi:hypothetical protein
VRAYPILIVELPVPRGREEEWNAWYHTVHIPDVLRSVAGVMSSRRYRLVAGDNEYVYLVIHEFESSEKLLAYHGSAAVAERWADYGRQWGMPAVFRRRGFEPVWADGSDDPLPVQDR